MLSAAICTIAVIARDTLDAAAAPGSGAASPAEAVASDRYTQPESRPDPTSSGTLKESFGFFFVGM
jgi:hypothetical protein